MKDMEKFDNYFKDQLAEHEITPPAGFWHQVSEQLNHEDQVEEITVITERKTPFYKSALKLAAVIAIAFGIGSVFYLQNSTQQAVVATTIKTAVTPETIIKADIKAVDEATSLAITSPVKVVSVKKHNIKIELQKPTEKLLSAKVEDVSMPVLAQEEKAISSTANDMVDIQNTNIPVYSLKLLNSRIPENDEITVIEKNKNEKGISDSKKVIIIEKNISKKPEIYFQVPLRF